jgi:hypothetical protein
LAVIELLHLVRRSADELPLQVAHCGGDGHAVLLLGDGVCQRQPPGLRVFSAARCARERGVPPPGEALEDAAIVELLLHARRVISW